MPVSLNFMDILKGHGVRLIYCCLLLLSRSVCLHTRSFPDTIALALAGSVSLPVAEPWTGTLPEPFAVALAVPVPSHTSVCLLRHREDTRIHAEHLQSSGRYFLHVGQRQRALPDTTGVRGRRNVGLVHHADKHLHWGHCSNTHRELLLRAQRARQRGDDDRRVGARDRGLQHAVRLQHHHPVPHMTSWRKCGPRGVLQQVVSITVL